MGIKARNMIIRVFGYIGLLDDFLNISIHDYVICNDINELADFGNHYQLKNDKDINRLADNV